MSLRVKFLDWTQSKSRILYREVNLKPVFTFQ